MNKTKVVADGDARRPRGGKHAGLVDPDSPGVGAPAADALPPHAPAGAPRHLERPASDAPAPLAPFFFFRAMPELEGADLPAPFAPGLQVKHL